MMMSRWRAFCRTGNMFHVRRERLDHSREGAFIRKRCTRYASTLTGVALLTCGLSCVPVSHDDEAKTKESIWSPIVTDASFSIDGHDVGLRIYDLKPGITFGTPGISIRDGGALRVKGVRCRPVQVKQSVGGMSILDVSGTPGPTRFSNLEVRLRCTVRKQMRATAFGHGRDDCFDEKDELFSDWLTRPAGDWEFQLPEKGWNIQSRWDYLRIQVQVREEGSSAIVSMPSIVNATVRLLPTDPRKRLAWMAAHSAIAALSDNGPCQSVP